MRLVLFGSRNFILQYIMEQYRKAFQDMGHEVLVFEATSVVEEFAKNIEKVFLFHENGIDAVITFNNQGFRMRLKEEAVLWDKWQIPCFNILVDHPMYYNDVLDQSPVEGIVVCADRKHVEYVKRFYPMVQRSFFLPTGGEELHPNPPKKPIADRPIDVLLIGSYKYHTDYTYDAVDEMVMDYLITHPQETMESAMEFCLKSVQPELSDWELKLMLQKHCFIETNLCAMYRLEIVRSMVEAGINVCVCGEGWENTDLYQHPNLKIYTRIPFMEGIALMEESKIVLNQMAWFKDGGSERIFNAMLQKAVCLTDDSIYLKEHFKHKEDIIFYSLSVLEELPGVVKELLEQPDKMQEIADNGYKKALTHHTWVRRAEELAEKIHDSKKRLQIYVMTHVAFEAPQNPIYCPLHVGRALKEDLGYQGDNTGDHISELNPYYSELTGLYWVWKNVKTTEYIGLCHYRRYFLNKDNKIMSKADFMPLLEQYDVIVSHPVISDQCYRDNYAQAHNIHDLEAVGEAIALLYPDCTIIFQEVLEGRKIYCGNLFVTTKKLFDEYAEWLFSIFRIVERKIDVSTYDDYHKRVYGFLSEQLIYVWIRYRNLTYYEAAIGFTQEKAETVLLKNQLSALFRKREIGQAHKLFLDTMKTRPDVMLAGSDFEQELKTILQIIHICMEEEKEKGTSMLDYSTDLSELIRYYHQMEKDDT
ncbi:MAG: DUF4422 domain-containing protein [Lachnospiraceae bacterium]|nr:DUF4422 domain-containing protein [Lachnospiraceae bacterium]